MLTFTRGLSASRERNICFEDGVQKVDFVLAYADTDDETLGQFRESCLVSFRARGLQLELVEEECKVRKESKAKSGYGTIKENEEEETKVHFIKVHAPIEVLYDAAEEVKMKMPTQDNDIDIKEWYEDNPVYRFFAKHDPFKLRRPETETSKLRFVATFNEERLSEFINYDQPDLFFTPAERGRLVYYILQKVKFGEEESSQTVKIGEKESSQTVKIGDDEESNQQSESNQKDIGIANLIFKGALLDAFPLHDGPSLADSKDSPVNERQRLQHDWANMRCTFKYQPIDAIRGYFGEKVALYFSWLGFYTTYLIPAAIMGLVCFIYGVVSTTNYPPMLESCNKSANFYMCPLCDRRCPYYLLSDNCDYALVTHWFDNDLMLLFAVFMSIWSTIYLELWKRYQVSLAYEWHSIGYKEGEEVIRPEYEFAATSLLPNPVTGYHEPHIPTSKRVLRLMGTVGTVLFFVALVVIAVGGVVVFKAAFIVALFASKDSVIRDQSRLIVSAAAGFFNLVVINMLRLVYQKVAVILTEWENPRTRTDYEDSFTIKMFLFQFFNTYSMILYVAFLKMEFVSGTPGRYKYYRFGKIRFRFEGCSSQGCFLELTVQLFIIMVGQQLISLTWQYVIPTVTKWRNAKKTAEESCTVATEKAQWVDDYECVPQDKFDLFWEYLEIVLRYGFVTMFVAAFPLAPLFALLNNIIEIRVDAYKYLHNKRRPVAQRAEDIGVWYEILASLTSVSVLVNACVIAFSSELIPRMVYRYAVSTNGTMHGYVNWSLSTFNVSDFEEQSRPANETMGVVPPNGQCRYSGFYESSWPYQVRMEHWMVLTAKVSFVLAFVIFVVFATWPIGHMIPDMPKSLELKIKREDFLASEADKSHKERTCARKFHKHKNQPEKCHDDHTEDYTTTSVV